MQVRLPVLRLVGRGRHWSCCDPRYSQVRRLLRGGKASVWRSRTAGERDVWTCGCLGLSGHAFVRGLCSRCSPLASWRQTFPAGSTLARRSAYSYSCGSRTAHLPAGRRTLHWSSRPRAAARTCKRPPRPRRCCCIFLPHGVGRPRRHVRALRHPTPRRAESIGLQHVSIGAVLKLGPSISSAYSRCRRLLCSARARAPPPGRVRQDQPPHRPCELQDICAENVRISC